MAITSAICTSFKVELLKGVHNFTATTGNTFKIALYTSSATLGAGTTAYSTSNEITNTSGTAYTAGGATLTSVTPTSDSTTAVCDFSDISFTSATISVQAAVIYNSSTVSGLTTNAAVCVLDFGLEWAFYKVAIISAWFLVSLTFFCLLFRKDYIEE